MCGEFAFIPSFLLSLIQKVVSLNKEKLDLKKKSFESSFINTLAEQCKIGSCTTEVDTEVK